MPHPISISNLPSANKSSRESRTGKDVDIMKKIRYSLLRTFLKEKGKPGFCQFLKFGRKAGVFSAHSINKTPYFALKNSSSANIIRS